ncbi:MAG: hypothetical protein ACRD50_07110 [Candidatus Acidiferrales bacterium]
MDAKLMKELRQIRNLLILLALKSDATTEEVGKVTGIGASNISALVPQRPRKKTKKERRRNNQ